MIYMSYVLYVYIINILYVLNNLNILYYTLQYNAHTTNCKIVKSG